MSSYPVRPPAEEQAAAYFASLRSGEMTAEAKVELDRWLDEDPANRAVMNDLARFWSSLDVVAADPTMLAMREQARQRLGRRRAWAVAACIAGCLALGSVTLWSVGRQVPVAKAPVAQLYTTRVGEISTVELVDGSTVVLDTDSVIRVSATKDRRSVELVRGRALFNVRPDASRPFVVAAEERTVTALGTEFEVYARPAGIEVVLHHGRVRVQQQVAGTSSGGALRAVEMTPGYRLTETAEDWSLQRIDTGLERAWVNGQLIFDEQPLSVITAELNRYSDEKIILGDAEVGRRRMSAVLRASDASSFIASVASLQVANVARIPGGYRLSTAR
jgi:transmembrane sensor